MKCNNCGFDIKFTEAVFCPNCGAKTGKKEADENATVRDPGLMIPDISHVWSEWKLVKMLGKGSYGKVFEAVRNDSGIESRAAIKIISIPTDKAEIDSLRTEGLDENSTREYFRHIVNDFVEEIRLMESFKGVQNIVSVEDYRVVEKSDEIGWDIYIRMELLTPFDKYVSDKKLTEKEILKLGIDIATALEMCSRKNVIHRDIKPGNVFINDFGYFKLGDFGVARTLENKTAGLSQKGTYNFMAPEVMYMKDYDTRVDIYSLGIMLYKLLNANLPPFITSEKQIVSYQDRKEAIERRMSGERLPAPVNASAAASHVVLKACAFRPDERYSSATQFKQALIQVLHGAYIPDNKDEPGGKGGKGGNGGNGGGEEYHPEPPKNRSYVSIVIIAIALGLLTGILVGGIVLLVKFRSGELSLHIDPLSGAHYILQQLLPLLNMR